MDSDTIKLDGWLWFDSLVAESTNSLALAWAENASSRQQAVFTAVNQTNGRGRNGRHWFGGEGNLFMSLCFEADIHDLTKFVFISSLSLFETVVMFVDPASYDIKLKWPNDVLINGAKVSGILLEKAAGNYLVSGIGVNLLHAPVSSGLFYPATTLKDCGADVNRIVFLKKFLALWNKNITLWRNNGFQAVLQKWLKFTFPLGTEIRFSQNNVIESGVFAGMDENGALLLQKENGVVEKKLAGDVFL